MTLGRLQDVFRDVMKRKHNKIDPIRSKFGKIEKEEVSLPEKLEVVERYARFHGRFQFAELLEAQTSKMQVVVTFLAVLELMKTGKIQVEQEETFGEIFIVSMMEA